MKKMMIVLAGLALFCGANRTSCADYYANVASHLADTSRWGGESKELKAWLAEKDILLNEANIKNQKLKTLLSILIDYAYTNSARIENLEK